MAVKIYELIDIGQYQSQEVLSRYHFADLDGVADPAILVSDFKAHVLPFVASMQSPNMAHQSITYRQVYPAVALQQESAVTPPINGTDGPGEDAMSYSTLSFKWVLGDTVYLPAPGDGKHIKRGGKHIGGVLEANFQNGVFNRPGMAAIAAGFYAAFTTLSDDNWQLCVVHQPPAVNKVAQPVTKYALVTGSVLKGGGTQVSRRVGHGR